MSYPTSWIKYDDAAPYVDPKAYGFSASVADINRWGARFRSARAFKGLELEGYSQAVQAGYSALCRVVFTWSAFERFLPIVGFTQDTCSPLFASPASAAVAHQVAQLDAERRFYGFVHSRANTTHKTELSLWQNNDPYNFTYLVSAIRHIFAHGYLTPSVEGMDPADCCRICDLLCDHLLEIMDNEFTRKVESL